MPDPALVPVTPLGGTAPRIDRIGAITITEVVDLALVSLARRAGPAEAFDGPAQALLGSALPGPGTGTAGAIGAFWTGPGQWMLHARGPEHAERAALAARVKTALGDAASVTDQGDGWCAFAVEGDNACDLLERLCNLDWSGMSDGAASRTTIDHLSCLVLNGSGARCFTVLAPRSGALSIHHALIIGAGAIA